MLEYTVGRIGSDHHHRSTISQSPPSFSSHFITTAMTTATTLFPNLDHHLLLNLNLISPPTSTAPSPLTVSGHYLLSSISTSFYSFIFACILQFSFSINRSRRLFFLWCCSRIGLPLVAHLGQRRMLINPRWTHHLIRLLFLHILLLLPHQRSAHHLLLVFVLQPSGHT